jgi:hypothetical protein
MMSMLLSFGIPVLIGAVAGAGVRRGSSGLLAHAGRVFLAFIVAVVVLYTSGYFLGISAAGGRASPATLLESMSFLFSRYGVLYLLVSAVTTLPLTAVGYAGGALLGGLGGEERGKTS